MTDHRPSIASALKAFSSISMRQAALDLLGALGYRSDKTVTLEGSKPKAFLDFIAEHNPEAAFDENKALFPDWKSADLLFQLTDEEISHQTSLFQDTTVKPSLLRSYLFFAIELSGGDYARGKLTAIARQINRVFPMPVMVLIKHGSSNHPAEVSFGSRDKIVSATLSIAVINRRQNKVRADKDVLGQVTIIRDISLASPHRGHLDILDSFAFANLIHPERRAIHDFDTLHAAWERIFNVELLNKNFYDELANWFFWAKKHVHFPLYDTKADKYDLFREPEKVMEHEAKNLIRLLTRTLFVWFIKERGLVPSSLFSPAELKETVLTSFDPESEDTNYYKAILQNLFFATLNQTHGERGFRKEGQHQNTTTLLRYKDRLSSPANFVKTIEASIPFLNGGLFECLDRPHPTRTGPQGGKVIIYEEGFSDRKDNPLKLPDFLFFGKPRTEDLAGEDSFGLANKHNAKVRGLIHILDSYKFTIVENTPIDQEIALDPELLGQVFENLLASYNPETKTTARKQTGSFYTPRPIVDYMVDESLKAHLSAALVKDAKMGEADAEAGLDILFAYTEREHAFTPAEVNVLIEAIDSCKILDPACGSGAFPMGALQKLVYILGKLDPRDELWERRQLAKVDKLIETAQDIDDTTFRERAIADAEAQKRDIEEAFTNNELGYGRKLYLIENCLYGVDIQSIATQVSKLRFFISLIVDQTVDRNRENFGVRPLPNLETKFVTADSLICIEKPSKQSELFELVEVSKLQRELKQVRHELFAAKTPRTKNAKRQRDKELRESIAADLKQNGWHSDAAAKLAAWDPYDQNVSAPYFDPEWMFGLTGFDIVIGNPPYIQIQKFPKEQKDKWVAQHFQTYTASADIYCLFYERGAQLLREGGHLAYITSNKWMRAGYGDLLRAFLSAQVDTHAVLDFGMAQNFGAATTYTCITQFTRQPSQQKLRACYASDDRAAMRDPAGYFEKNAVVQNDLTDLPWVILPPDRHAIKKQVEAQGIPLAEWDIAIYRGVLTGFNDAFYLTQEQRDAFVAEDPRCADHLVPLLRGRYVSRYATNWDGTWMVNSHNGVRSQEIPPVDLARECPPLYRHLEQWETELRKRQDKGDHWSNLRNCAYLKEFTKPKIIYPNMTKFLPFYYDRHDGYFGNQKCFIITTESKALGYLTAFFNSSLFKCCFRENFPELMGNTYELSKIFMDILPVRKPSPAEAALFEKLVPLVQFAKKAQENTAAMFLEDLIDACVLECYFRKHMAERDLLFHDVMAPLLAAYDPDASENLQHDFLTSLHQTLNAPSHPIRNQLIRLTAESPDLLAIIKREGRA